MFIGKINIGIPELGLTWIRENKLLENQELEPEIIIYNQFEQLLAGRDQQLEWAVKEMLKVIKK